MFLVSISVGLQAQYIEIPLSNRPADVYLGDTNIVVAVIPANTGQIDSFGYVTTRFPTFVAEDGFVTYEQINTAWNNRQYQNPEYIINGKVYKTDKRKLFAALRNRKGIALFQRVRIFDPQMAEKSIPEKFWYLYEYMIDNNIPNETFWNSLQVDSLVNPPPVPIDTTLTAPGP